MRRRLALMLTLWCVAFFSLGGSADGASGPRDDGDARPGESHDTRQPEGRDPISALAQNTFVAGIWHLHVVRVSVKQRTHGLVATPGTVIYAAYCELTNHGSVTARSTAADFRVADAAGRVYECLHADREGWCGESGNVLPGDGCTLLFVFKVPKLRGLTLLHFSPADGGNGASVTIPLD